MKTTKRLLTALLALLSVASLALTSCGQDTPDSQNDETTSVASEDGSEAETEGYDGVPFEVPELNLNGASVTFLAIPSEGYAQQVDLMYSDEAAGEPINDATKARIRSVEERFNVKIKSLIPETQSELVNVARRELLAGSDSFDIIMPTLLDIKTLSTEGLLLDLKEIDTIKLEKPWYSQSVNENLSLKGKLYFTMGDISLIDNNAVGPIGFNKQLIADNNLESPYTYVFDGTWTLDKMFEMASAVGRDANGDGVMDASDVYGFVSDSANAKYFIYGAGQTFVSKDENDLPYSTINNERTINVLDKYITFTSNNMNYAETKLFGGHGEANAVFMNNQMLFRQTTMYRFSQMRDMNSDFGFVTVPKFDEAQENYVHGYADGAVGVSIPFNAANPEELGAIVEAMSYYGRDIMLPAYLEVTFKTKVTRDEESKKVLELIYDTATIDLGLLYNFGDLTSVFANMIENGVNIFTSEYARVESTIEEQIQSLISEVEALEAAE